VSAETVPELLRAAVRRWGAKPALKSMHEAPVTFAELDRQADRFARALIADGMTQGERLAIWAPNSWEWVAAAAGAQRAGAAVVPLNVRLRAAELDDVLRRAGVTRLVSAGELRGSWCPDIVAGLDLPQLRRIVVLRPGTARLRARETAWDAFLALGAATDDAALQARERAVGGDEVADILFTSGTTGRPKGAVFRHRSTVRSAGNMVNFARVDERDCLCPLGPFSHLAGYKAGWVNGLLTGATVCWLDAHDPVSVLDAIQRLGVTVMPAPPVVWQDVLDHPARGDWDLRSLRFVATGSTTIPPHLVARLIAELRVEQVGTGYGLTESGGLVAFSRPDDTTESVAHTAGRAAPDAEIAIVDGQGRRAAAGEAGEIVVRTGRMLCEYLDDPAATRAAIGADGWLRTGDVGTIDAEGYLRVTDRLKDMYIANGFNVYPAEVEKLLGRMPGLAQCAVVGVPDRRRGEAGHAFVVCAEGARLTAAQVVDWCRENMAGYKVPAGVTFVADLPRNLQGKVLKQELRALL
jgi:acyl-CoA synthetase (AMP-forming)/AMP-acid ligase II